MVETFFNYKSIRENILPLVTFNWSNSFQEVDIGKVEIENVRGIFMHREVTALDLEKIFFS